MDDPLAAIERRIVAMETLITRHLVIIRHAQAQIDRSTALMAQAEAQLAR